MVNTAPAFSSAKQAAELKRAGLGFLAAADATADGGGDPGAVPADPGADQLDGHRGRTCDTGRVHPPRRAAPPTPTTAPGLADPQNPRDQRRRRRLHRVGAPAAAHPSVRHGHAGGAGEMSESVARNKCPTWTGKLPEDCRPAAGTILLTAARASAEPARPGGTGRGDLPAPSPRTRTRARTGIRRWRTGWVRLETTFGGAGVLLWGAHAGVRGGGGARCWTRCPRPGPEPGESGTCRAQRYSDGLQEAMPWFRFCIVKSVTCNASDPCGGSRALSRSMSAPREWARVCCSIEP